LIAGGWADGADECARGGPASQLQGGDNAKLIKVWRVPGRRALPRFRRPDPNQRFTLALSVAVFVRRGRGGLAETRVFAGRYCHGKAGAIMPRLRAGVRTHRHGRALYLDDEVLPETAMREKPDAILVRGPGNEHRRDHGWAFSLDAVGPACKRDGHAWTLSPTGRGGQAGDGGPTKRRQPISPWAPIIRWTAPIGPQNAWGHFLTRSPLRPATPGQRPGCLSPRDRDRGRTPPPGRSPLGPGRPHGVKRAASAEGYEPNVSTPWTPIRWGGDFRRAADQRDQDHSGCGPGPAGGKGGLVAARGPRQGVDFLVDLVRCSGMGRLVPSFRGICGASPARETVGTPQPGLSSASTETRGRL